MKFGVKQLAILLLALVFLFETWVWGSMVAAARVVAAFIPWTRFQIWARGVVNRLPAIVVVLLFGVAGAVPGAAVGFGVCWVGVCEELGCAGVCAGGCAGAGV